MRLERVPLPESPSPDTPRSPSTTRTCVAAASPARRARADQVVLPRAWTRCCARAGRGWTAGRRSPPLSAPMRGGDLAVLTHRRPPSSAAVRGRSLWRSRRPAARSPRATCRLREAGSASTAAGRRMRVWHQAELHRLHGSPPWTVTCRAACSRHLPVPARPDSHTSADACEQVRHRSQRRRAHPSVAGVLLRRRSTPAGIQPLAAIGQHHQQLQPRRAAASAPAPRSGPALEAGAAAGSA